MLTAILNLDTITDRVFDYLYSFFERDFVKNNTYLNNCIYINPRSNLRDENKEKTFWHLTTRNIDLCGEKTRVLDLRRSERIEWVKIIIQNYTDKSVKMFYHMESDNKIRLYLWAYNENFVVILQKLGKKDSYLVTSFYIDYGKKRKDFEKRYSDYKNKTDRRLISCEWF